MLYTDNSGQYVFRNELDAVTASHPFITIEYMDSTRLPDRISASIAGQGNRAAYFVSGPVIMVKEIKGSLFLQGIEKKNIVHEPFFGL